MKNLAKTAVLAALAIILVAASSFAWSGGEINETYSAKEIVNIETVSGDCIIKKSSSDKIEVQLRHDVHPVRNFEPEIQERGRSLKIEENFYGQSSGYSEWTIGVPEGTRIRFNTASGNFSVAGIKGEFDVNTASGDIEIVDCRGEFDLNSASGNIVLDKCSGDFNANTASGDIYASGILIEEISDFSSASGDVEIELGKTLDVDMSLSTASGRVELNYNGNPVKGYFEFVARAGRERIRAPYDFDSEETFRRHGEKYVAKAFTKETDSPQILIETASGRVALVED